MSRTSTEAGGRVFFSFAPATESSACAVEGPLLSLFLQGKVIRQRCETNYSLESVLTPPTKIPSGGLSKWLQGHFVAQAFQPADQGSADSVHVDPVKVVRTEFPVVFLTLQHVIGNLQQRMCYRHDGALGSPPSSNAPIQRREVVVLHHRDGPSRLRQTTAERA